MKTAIICFSQRGLNIAGKLKTGLKKSGHEAEISVKSRYIKNRDVHCVTESLNDWTARQFQEKEALFFIGACGIAVRAIAPFVKSKDTDPAVIAVDEAASFAVPLLSGHLGGANDLAEQAAFLTGAIPVITTATDINQVFAVDLFAKKHRLHIMDLGLAKEISASLLSGMPVGFHSDFPVSGNLPEGLVRGEDTKLGICISVRKDFLPFQKTLRLIPKAVVFGVGCRKDTPEKAIKQAFLQACEKGRIEPLALGLTASIDLKKEERGLLVFCREKGIPFQSFTAEELMQAEGVFMSSAFVSRVTGADNVCERSALLAAGDGGELIVGRQAGNGVTAALALKDWRIRFES